MTDPVGDERSGRAPGIVPGAGSSGGPSAWGPGLLALCLAIAALAVVDSVPAPYGSWIRIGLGIASLGAALLSLRNARSGEDDLRKLRGSCGPSKGTNG